MKQFTTSLMLLVAFLFTSNHLSAQTYHEGNWYSLYQGEFELATSLTSISGEQQDFTVFAPTNGNLQFDYIYVLWAYGIGGVSKVQKTHIYEITNYGKDTIEMAIVEGTDIKNIMSANVSLSTNIDSVRFDRPVGNTNTVKYTNVRLPLAYHILLADNAYGKSTDSLTFEEKPLFQVSEPQTIPLRSFHAAGDITITCQHPDVFRIGSPDNTSAVTWAVGPNACASQNGQDGAMAAGEVLGDIDMYSLTIYFCPQHAIDYTDTIVISDGVSSATIAVAGKGLPIGQSIDWQFTDTQMTVDETIALTATATSGLEVAFTIVGDQTMASINNNQLTAHKAGTITVQASQAGNADYFAAETISHTINISKATPQITELPTIAPVTYGTTLAEALVLNGGKASVEGTFNITKPTAEELTQVWDAGEHTIHITFVPTMADAYNSVEATTTLTITQATQTIDWTIDATTLLVNATLPLNATASSGLEVTYTITDGQDIVAIEGNNIVAKKAGTATITASQAGNNNYLAAASVAQTITVEKATPQITELPTIAPVTYGTTLAEALVLNGGKASVEGTFNITKPTAEELTQVWDAGEHPIHITFVPTMADAYNSVEATTTLTITPATQTIDWTIDATTLLVNATLPLNATASSGLEVTYTITDGQDIVAIEGNNIVAKKAGTATITASQAGNNNYLAAASVAQTITVEKATPQITELPTIAPVTYGTTLAEALVLNGGKASVEGTFTFILPTHEDYLQQVWDAGEYAISIAFYPTQEEAYYSIDTTVVLLIEKAAQTIAWTLDSTNLFVNDTIILAATASSELPVTYEVTGDEGVVTIQDNVLVAIQAGTITITASQEGSNNYLAAEPVVFTLTVEDIPSAIIDVPTNEHTKKFMLDGKIYILHNGVYYDTLGNTIK